MPIDPGVMRLADLYGFTPNPSTTRCSETTWSGGSAGPHGVVIGPGDGLIDGNKTYYAVCAVRALRQLHTDELDEGRRIDIEFGGSSED